MIVRAADLTELWHTACEKILYARREQVDYASSGYTWVYDNVFTAESMDFDFDIGKDVWLTRQRWHKLQRDYLNPIDVLSFIDRAALVALKIGRRGTVTHMPFRPQLADHERNIHVWGGCLLTISFRGGTRFSIPPTINLHSRACFIAFMGPLDICIALCLAREIGKRTGIDPAEIRFRWYIDAVQWHSFKSVPYIMAHDHYDEVMDEEKHPKEVQPAMAASRSWIKRFETTPPEGFKFGQANRMSKRWQQVYYGKGFPSIHADTLELLPEMLGEGPPPKRRRKRGVSQPAD